MTQTKTKVNADGLITGPLCPFKTNTPCLGTRCAIYNDDLLCCTLASDSLHLLARTAITDAAVEIVGQYYRAKFPWEDDRK